MKRINSCPARRTLLWNAQLRSNVEQHYNGWSGKTSGWYEVDKACNKTIAASFSLFPFLPVDNDNTSLKEGLAAYTDGGIISDIEMRPATAQLISRLCIVRNPKVFKKELWLNPPIAWYATSSACQINVVVCTFVIAEDETLCKSFRRRTNRLRRDSSCHREKHRHHSRRLSKSFSHSRRRRDSIAPDDQEQSEQRLRRSVRRLSFRAIENLKISIDIILRSTSHGCTHRRYDLQVVLWRRSPQCFVHSAQRPFVDSCLDHLLQSAVTDQLFANAAKVSQRAGIEQHQVTFLIFF